MAELGSTGGNLDNILQYLLQRIERIAEGGTGGGGGDADLSDYVKKGDVRTFSIFNSDGTSLLSEFNPLGESNQEMRILTADDLKDYVQADDVKTMTWHYYDADGNKQRYNYNPLGKTDGELDFTAGLVSASTHSEHVEKFNTFVEKFDSMFELTEDDKIKAKMSFYSTGDISAYGDADSQIPSAEVSVIPIYKEEGGILIATINGTEIYAPKGGSDVDLSKYYDKEEINSMFAGLDSTYATDADIANIIKAIGDVNNRFADFALKAGDNTLTGTNTFEGNARFNANQTWFDGMYIEKNSAYGGFGNGAYFGWNNVANMKLLPTMLSSNILLYTGLITPRVDFNFGSAGEITSSIVESASGVLELLGNSNGVGTLKIGNAYITYDSDNNALFVKGANGSAINLVATGDVAAFSGLGSGFDTLTDLTLTNSLNINGSYLRGLVTTIRNVNYYGLNVADQPLVIGTPQLPVHLSNYKDYGLLAYKKARFSEKVEFVSDIDITTLRINSELYVNPNDTSAKIYIGGTNANYAVEKMFADGTNVYITINGKQYKLANA